MSSAVLSLVMDFVVLLALAGTIYYALRLSSALNNFKAHREEMRGLIVDLSAHIDKAQAAIEGLKAASDSAANDLDDVLHDSRRMAEELKMINETSDSLASRLESASRSGRRSVSFEEPEPEAALDVDEGEEEDFVPDMPSFFIQDVEFERRDDRGPEPKPKPENENKAGSFVSKAEKELYEALQRNKQVRGGGRR